MKDRNMKQGLWAATAPSKPRLTSLQGDQRTDIAIIGGGYTGLSAALHLAKMGKESVVLEAEDIGYGGAGRNVGLVNAGLWLMPEELLRLAGPEYGEKLIDVLGDSPDLQQREAQWLKRGAPVRLLERDEAASKTGSTSFYGALLDKRAGTIQPLAYAYGLANAALKAGAQLYNQSPVVGFEKTRDGWKLDTPTGTLTAKSVIIAVHAYPSHAFKSNKKSMVQMSFFQFATPPLSKDVLETVLPGRLSSGCCRTTHCGQCGDGGRLCL